MWSADDLINIIITASSSLSAAAAAAAAAVTSRRYKRDVATVSMKLCRSQKPKFSFIQN